MKQLLTILAKRNSYLLLAAVIIFTTVFLLNKYVVSDTSAHYYTTRIQNDIQQKEKDFQELCKDSIVLQSLIRQTYDQKLLNTLLEEKKGYGFFIYSLDNTNEQKLLFWNTQIAVPPVNLMQETDVSRMVTLKNGVYVHTSKIISIRNQRYAIEALIPVLWKYFVEIENLQTEFASFPNALKSVSISAIATEFKVSSSYGNTLFYLQPVAASRLPSSWWMVISILVGVFLLFWFIHQVAHSIYLNKGLGLGLAFLFVVLIAIRLVIYFFPNLLDLRQFELFDPAIYSTSFLLGSLGDLLINALLFCWITFYINRRFSESSIPKYKSQGSNAIAGILLLSVLVFITFLFARILQSLVADGQISFNVTNFFSLSRYSAIGFLILATLALSYFLLAQVILKMVMEYASGYAYMVYIITATLGLAILTFTQNTAVVELNLFVLIWLVIFIWLMSKMAAVIVTENRKIEEEQRRQFAEKLSFQADPSNERLLSIAFTYLDNDFLAPNFNRFRDKPTNLMLKDSIINKNFSAYLNKFDTRIYVFDAATNPTPLYNEEPVSYDSLNLIYNVQGKKTGINDLHYFELSFDKYSYIWKKEVKNSDSTTVGYFFILADMRKYKKDALVPELFKQTRESLLPEYSMMYSYAIYSDGKLIEYFNEYGFPTDLKNAVLPQNEFDHRSNAGYDELWYRKTSKKVVIVAKKNNSFIEAITLFAYLFSTFLLLLVFYWLTSVLVRSRLRWSALKKSWQFTIRSQIHSTIILVSLLSFVVIGVATIFFFINRYNRNNQERLSRTMQIMVNQVQSRLEKHVVFNDGIPFFESGVNDELEKLLQETSEIHGTDINLYDPNGDLKVTSRPLIYNKGVLSEKINPDAWFSLHVKNAVQTVKEERMGKVDYLSIYNPVRNEAGQVFAYLNVPSYSTQVELTQEISYFLVTLINLNAFIFLVAGAIALFISNRITSSFTVIGAKMRAMNLGQINQEIEWNRNDEIGELVTEYNKMVRQLEQSAAALAKSEREGAWRQMARQVAHEIKNPLTPMKLSIQYLQKAIDNNSPNVKEMTSNVARTLVEQIDHLSKIASDFSQFANIGNPRNEVFDMHEVFYSLSSLYEATDNLDFHWQPVNQRVMVFADKTQLNRLFTNLMQNAIEASSHQPRRKIDVNESLDQEYITISIKDNGEGIPEQTRSKIFTPNFTTKTSGTGLGLAMSKSIVENAHGQIWFETEEGEGTTFFVKLPLLRATN